MVGQTGFEPATPSPPEASDRFSGWFCSAANARGIRVCRSLLNVAVFANNRPFSLVRLYIGYILRVSVRPTSTQTFGRCLSVGS